MNIKEKIIDKIKELNKPLMDIEIARIFEIDKNQYKNFFTILESLESDGKLIVTKKKKYGTPEMFNLKAGKIQGTQKDFAFFIPDDESEDVFIPPSGIMGAMNGDTVLISISEPSAGGKRMEGQVEKLIKRANEEIVGTYQKNDNFGFVVADDKKLSEDIYIANGKGMNGKTGDKVLVKIIKWPREGKKAEGKIIEVLGQKGENNADILSVIKKFKLPEEFPKKVLNEADAISEEVDENEIKNRRDLRDKIIFTIDGADAKDLDDAVSIELLKNGNFLLGVHIADVTHYVKEGSKLDLEAIERATSVYLIDRVIPMLPRKLSNGICSLNPKINRLTLSIDMEIDKDGVVVNHDIYESIIKTAERLVYTDVSDILEGVDRPDLIKYDYLADEFKNMEKLQKILRQKREKRGMIDFNFPEAKIILDKEGFPVSIGVDERRIANKIIEEFMLVANETIAEHMHWMELPFVYRIHELPSEEKINTFNKFIHNFGYFVKGQHGEVHPKAIQNLLKKIEGKKEEHIISKMVLRSLRQAKYSPVNEGHFGLASDYYCHFTSPIRRYPDLQIHRIIKEMIKGKLSEKRIEKLITIVDEISKQSSEKERIAEKAERDTDDLKITQYMTQFVGDDFNGIISSITSFGMYVEIFNLAEGLVHVRNLSDDYYYYDEETLSMVGERTGKRYSIGDEVIVKISKTDIDNREIDLLLMGKVE